MTTPLRFLLRCAAAGIAASVPDMVHGQVGELRATGSTVTAAFFTGTN